MIGRAELELLIRHLVGLAEALKRTVRALEESAKGEKPK
jgi:hypothetical protein